MKDHRRPELGNVEAKDAVELQQRLKFNLGMYREAIELSSRLLLFLAAENELDLIDIHFGKTVRELIVLYSLIEPSDEVRLPFDIEKLLGSYVTTTGNIDQIIGVLNSYGLDSEDALVRFKMT